MNEKLINQIIETAYGDAGLFTRIKIHRLAAKNAEVKKLLDEYKATANDVKKLKGSEVPGYLFEEALKNKKTKPFLLDLYLLLFEKPAVSVAVTAVLLLSITFAVYFKNPPANPEQQLTEQELIEANEEARKAFELIGSIFQNASNSIKEEIIDKKLNNPLKEGMIFTNGLFNRQGEKDEKTN